LIHRLQSAVGVNETLRKKRSCGWRFLAARVESQRHRRTGAQCQERNRRCDYVDARFLH
jgi:hypothetical protein